MGRSDLSPSSASEHVEMLSAYEAMMARYVPDREGRFDVILDAIAACCPDDLVALDAACGPGSFSHRLLARFPSARCVGVDADPALLEIARAAGHGSQGRLTLVPADLTADEPIAELQPGAFDVVVTTSSTHYLNEAELQHVYRRFRNALRVGGILLNADELAVDADQPHLHTATRWAQARRDREADDAGIDDWASWWRRLERKPALGSNAKLPPSAHEAALRTAGFHDVTTIWQHLDSRVLIAAA